MLIIRMMDGLDRLTKIIISSIIISFFTFTPALQAEKLVTPQEVIKIENKIAKNYAGKFCNALAIGVSRDGAARLAIAENAEAKFNPGLWSELIFSGEDKINKVDDTRLIKRITEEIYDKCGYASGFSGREGYQEFNEYFLNIYTSEVSSNKQ